MDVPRGTQHNFNYLGPPGILMIFQTGAQVCRIQGSLLYFYIRHPWRRLNVNSGCKSWEHFASRSASRLQRQV